LVNSKVKAKYVKMLTEKSDFTIGMGDSEGDFEMLELMDKAFMFEPFKDAEKIALEKNIPILNGDNVLEKYLEALQ
jgi:phosphoserine phosphatase